MNTTLLKLAVAALLLVAFNSSAFAITAKSKTLIVAPPAPQNKPIKSGL